jgi:hypothetical protein
VAKGALIQRLHALQFNIGCCDQQFTAALVCDLMLSAKIYRRRGTSLAKLRF